MKFWPGFVPVKRPMSDTSPNAVKPEPTLATTKSASCAPRAVSVSGWPLEPNGNCREGQLSIIIRLSP